MLNFNKNLLINEVLSEYYNTFNLTLDTMDFVPEKYNNKICKYIFKNMKKCFRVIDKEDRKYQRKLKKDLKKQNKIAKKNAKTLKKQAKITNIDDNLQKNSGTEIQETNN